MSDNTKTNQAFWDFFDRHYERCHFIAKQSLRDEKTVQDVIYKSMVEIWKKHLTSKSGFDDEATLIQSLGANIELALLDLPAAMQREISLYKRGERDIFISREEIKRLPKRRKEIFIMSRINNMSASEIAAKLGISARTVEKHIEFAKKQLTHLI